MSLYDAQYINYYTGLVPLIIEPTGMLYGANEANYSQLREEILLGILSFIIVLVLLFNIYILYLFYYRTITTFKFSDQKFTFFTKFSERI